jgi:hypothetical protein
MDEAMVKIKKMPDPSLGWRDSRWNGVAALVPL